MKKARVILLEGHNAKADQTIKCVSGQLYLKDMFSDRPAIYSIGEARKKANMFGGSAQSYQSKYDLTDEVKVAQIVEQNIPAIVLAAFATVEPSYVDGDKSIGEKMYSTDVIYDAMAQEAYDNDNTELELELRELYDYVSDYNYVVFTKC